MFGMLSVLAELQRELIVANTRDGLAAARARGRVGGRRPRLSPEQAALAQQLYDAGEKTVQQIADLFGVPRSTVYGYLNRDTTTRPRPSTGGRRPPVNIQSRTDAGGVVHVSVAGEIDMETPTTCSKPCTQRSPTPTPPPS